MTTTSFLPTWPMVTTKLLEMRKRRGLMVVVLLFTIGVAILVLGLRLLLHAVDPNSFGPAGSPTVFVGLATEMGTFGFIVAATLGATAGTTDLADGVFRNLVITGRSRVALYLARIPAGLSIVLSLLAVGFTMLCLVTSFASGPQPSALNVNGVNVPLNMSEAQLETWLLDHPGLAAQAFSNGSVSIQSSGPFGGGETGQAGPPLSPAAEKAFIQAHMSEVYTVYTLQESQGLPSINEMVKIGLWLVLELSIGFVVGLGFGSLVGQRTIATIVMIILELVVTPILAGVVIPYFINGQRLLVGVAMDQLRPILLSGGEIHGGGSRAFGGRALGIPPMPTWAMISVIIGWVVVWTVVGAWRMVTRDA